MAINERLIDTEVAAAAAAAVDTDNLMLDLDASDVDSYDGDGDVWYDIHDFEFKPTTNVAENFNTVLYNGQETPLSVTGVGFTPDLVWIKNRTAAYVPVLYDSVRGTGNTKAIYSSETSAQGSNPDNQNLSSFDLDGFTLGDTQNGGTNIIRTGASNDYVAWCFKAGGASVTNTNGDIDSQVSVNNDLGFSIVKYSGGNSSGTTVGHGLDVPPELIITKNISASSSWPVFVTGGIPMGSSTFTLQGSSQYLGLNSNTGFISYTLDKQFGGSANSGSSSQDIISYCFTSKRGVSKVGSYTGDGGTSNRIYTGFEPAFVLQKRTDNTSDWRIFDNVRGTKKELYANTSAQEPANVAYIDFNRDGFTLTNNGSWINGNTNKYIYYAVAKNTNETSLIANNLELNLDAASFDGSTNTPTTWTDSTSNGYVATITGAEFDSELGNSLKFSSDSTKIVVKQSGGGASSALTNVSNFTVEMWVNYNNDTGYNQLWGNMNSTGGQRQVYSYIMPSDQIEFTAYYGTGSNQYIQYRTGDVSSKIYGKWTHICWQLDSGVPNKLWIDGEQETLSLISGGGNTMRTNATSNFQIGGTNESVTNCTNGLIGQARMYHSVLTQDEIRQNYNFTKPSYPNYFHADIAGGTYNPAGYFDFDSSSDYVTVPATSTTPIDVRQSFSVATWVKFNVIGATHNFIENYSNGGTISFTLGVLIDGTINVTLKSGSTNNNTATAAGVVTTGSFRHIAVTRTAGTDVKIYLDKVLVKTAAYTSTPNISSSNVFTIGGKQWAFDGEISKVKMYNAALSETEIEALHSEGR